MQKTVKTGIVAELFSDSIVMKLHGHFPFKYSAKDTKQMKYDNG